MTPLARHQRVPLARRQLQAKPGRALAGVLGIGVALLLILALKAIFAGMETRLTAYIDSTGADVIVAQEGVETMHMTQSALPVSTAAAVASVRGVAAVTPIIYKGAFVEGVGDKSGIVAVVGGGPIPGLATGRRPLVDEIVLDRALAERLRVGVGDSVRVLGASLRVSGEVSGTAAITGSYAFVERSTLARILRSGDAVSYLLVRRDGGTDAAQLARRIEQHVSRVTASTRPEFATSERRVVGDMSTDIVRAMILVGFVIGVAVAGLVTYSRTLAQLRDYGVLRALGLSTRRALGLVLTQVAAIVTAGFVLAVLMVAVLALALPALSPTLVLEVRSVDLVGAGLVAAAVALAAALVPLLRVVRIEPASVYRRPS